MVNPFTVSAKASLHQINIGGVLYVYNPNNLTQTQASDWCSSRGLHLLHIHNQTDLQAVVDVTGHLQITGKLWTQVRGRTTDWHWVSGMYIASF